MYIVLVDRLLLFYVLQKTQLGGYSKRNHITQELEHLLEFYFHN